MGQIAPRLIFAENVASDLAFFVHSLLIANEIEDTDNGDQGAFLGPKVRSWRIQQLEKINTLKYLKRQPAVTNLEAPLHDVGNIDFIIYKG